MSSVRSCLGIVIEMPDSSSEERSYFQLGPGPTREVLDTLLSSTDFNYVIQSSSSAPEKITTILLSSRTLDAVDGGDSRRVVPEAGLVMTPARRAWIANRNANRPAETGPTEDSPQPASHEPVTSTTTEPQVASQGASQAGSQLASQVDPKAATMDANAPKDASKENDSAAKTVASDVPSTVAVATEAAPTSTASDTSQASTAAQELHNKISDMQQLFEQRKKMIANSSASPTQN